MNINYEVNLITSDCSFSEKNNNEHNNGFVLSNKTTSYQYITQDTFCESTYEKEPQNEAKVSQVQMISQSHPIFQKTPTIDLCQSLKNPIEILQNNPNSIIIKHINAGSKLASSNDNHNIETDKKELRSFLLNQKLAKSSWDMPATG